MKRPSIGVPGHLLEDFDEWAEEHHGDRSKAVRALMRTAVDSEPEPDTPLHPPAEERLAEPYRKLCFAASRDGVVPHEAAKNVCTNGPENLSKQEVTRLVLRPLNQRGYLKCRQSISGTELSTAWKIVGWESWKRGEASE
jgi:hypothetical protein